MDLELRDRIAFVSGASGGLGFASALELAREGCRVVVSSRSGDRIREAAERIVRETGVDPDRVIALTCDVTQEEQIADAVGEAVRTFGGINVLVTNAGGPPSGFVDDFDAEDWRQALELNLVSTVNLVRHALAPLREAATTSGHARIIMVTSLSAKQPIPSLYLSNASRAGVQGFAKSLAEELGPSGITVNTVLPGYTRTQRLSELAEEIAKRTGQTLEEIEEDWARQNAVRRLGEPFEFAATVAFLASRQAAYITGAAIPVDGGRSKHLL